MRRLLAATLALGALAIAPAAQAAPTLTTDAVAFKAYKMSLTLSKNGGGYSLGVVMTRGNAASSQFHYWSFPLSAKAVKLTAKGATIKTGSELGRYGKVNMTIATQSTRKGDIPCYGVVTSRRGTLAGTLNLKLDGAYFAAVSKRTLAASISGALPAPKPNCGPATGGPGGQQPTGTVTLSAFPQDFSAGGVSLSAQRAADGAVTHSAYIMESGATIAPASSIMHSISAKAPAAGLVATDDLSSATLAFASPFLAGNLTFTSSTPPMGTSAFGDVAGALTLKFDAPGVQTITANQASLSRS